MFPKLITIGKFFIPTYGTLVALGFLLGLWITVRLARRAKLPVEPVTNLAIYCALAGLAGAKLFMLLFDFGEYWDGTRRLFSLETLQAAGVYQGGFLLALLTAIIYMCRNRLPAFETCDVFAPGVAAGQAIGRLGCFAAGCCWGTECNRPWAVTFKSLDAHDLTNVPLGVPLHPAQLYEVGADALIFAALYWMMGRRHRSGTIIAWYLTLYSSARIVIEFFRVHEQGLHYGLSWTQWISAGTLVAGLGLLFLRRGAAKVS